MRGVVLGSLRTHGRRYVAAVVAVVIGVAFLVTTDALSSAARDGALAGLSEPYAGGDVVVSDIAGDQASRLLAEAGEEGADAAIIGWVGVAVSESGRQVKDRADVGAIAAAPELRWQKLREGRFPDRNGEAVVDRNAAKADGVQVGDRLRLGTGAEALDVVVVGIVDSPSSQVWADLYVTQSDHARWDARSHVESVVWRGAGSVAQAETLVRAMMPHATVQTVDEHVQAMQASVSGNVDVLGLMMLLFAAIAIFVSVLVIANTFTIVFAQRTRDFALLRCVGATRRQVLRSVRLEALLLGTVSAVLGLVVGTALGVALVAVVRAVSPSARMGHVQLSLGWYVCAWVVGVGVTLLAAWLPTRRATRVSPLAALAPDGAVDVHSRAGRARIAAGAGLGVLGVGLLAVASAVQVVVPMVAGGAAAFTAVLLLGPVVVPALMRVLGAPLRVLGPTGRLAADNSIRDPRRTAATTASLLVGVTLTTAVLTGLASARGSIDHEMNEQHPLDVALTASGEPLPAGVIGEVRSVGAVATARAVPGALGRLAGHGAVTVVAPTAADAATGHGSARRLRVTPGQILLPHDLAPERERSVTLTVQGRRVTLQVRRGEGWGEAALVAPETLRALTARPKTAAVWVRATASADAEDLVGDLSATVSQVDADVENGLARRAYVDLQLDVLTGAVLALLGIAVLVALVGIASTLGLSVLERSRENALLRALGLTRRQLRATLALEAVLCTAVAAIEGTLLGVAFAWVGVHTVVQQVVDESPVILPVGQLALVLAGTAVAGLLAAVLPARRAARVSPAAGLVVD